MCSKIAPPLQRRVKCRIEFHAVRLRPYLPGTSCDALKQTLACYRKLFPSSPTGGGTAEDDMATKRPKWSNSFPDILSGCSLRHETLSPSAAVVCNFMLMCRSTMKTVFIFFLNGHWNKNAGLLGLSKMSAAVSPPPPQKILFFVKVLKVQYFV